MINRCYRLLEVKNKQIHHRELYISIFPLLFCRSEKFWCGLCYTGPVHSTNQMASQGEGICASREVQVLGGDREPARLCLHRQWTSCSIVLQGWRVFHQEHSQGKKRDSQGYCLNNNIAFIIAYSQMLHLLYCSILFNAHILLHVQKELTPKCIALHKHFFEKWSLYFIRNH